MLNKPRTYQVKAPFLVLLIYLVELCNDNCLARRLCYLYFTKKSLLFKNHWIDFEAVLMVPAKIMSWVFLILRVFMNGG